LEKQKRGEREKHEKGHGGGYAVVTNGGPTCCDKFSQDKAKPGRELPLRRDGQRGKSAGDKITAWVSARSKAFKKKGG